MLADCLITGWMTRSSCGGDSTSMDDPDRYEANGVDDKLGNTRHYQHGHIQAVPFAASELADATVGRQA
jgi:hypothetical protein